MKTLDIQSRLFWNILCLCGRATDAVLHKRSSDVFRSVTSLQLRPEQTLQLNCTDGSENDIVKTEADSVEWLTPFGTFHGCQRHQKNPVETCHGALRSSSVTVSHEGQYFCVSRSKHARDVRMFTVMRAVRDAQEAHDQPVPQGNFVAGVTSSVIVSFLLAFTLGALSRPYVIQCLPAIRDNDDSTEASQTEIGVIQEQKKLERLPGGTEGENGAEDQSVDHQAISEEIESREKQEFSSVVSPHPQKKRRVIKVYNYDEDGRRYSHVTESEEQAQTKVRTKSLTRLSTIMNQAEALDRPATSRNVSDEYLGKNLS